MCSYMCKYTIYAFKKILCKETLDTLGSTLTAEEEGKEVEYH